MKPGICSIALIAGLALAAPHSADAFTSRRGAKVNPVNANVFEVVPRSSGNGQVFWCSAADYAQRALKAPWSAKIYIVRGRGVSETTGKKSSVQFTLNPEAAGVTPKSSSLNLNSLKVGESMSVQEGWTYCQKEPI